jgi:hypothetical protein
MSRLVAPALLLFYGLHQDLWFWREARPLVFGVLPIGLFYHAAYTLAVTPLVWGLIRVAWPAHLDEDSQPGRPAPDTGSRRG